MHGEQNYPNIKDAKWDLLAEKKHFYASLAAVNLQSKSQIVLLGGSLNLKKTAVVFLGEI